MLTKKRWRRNEYSEVWVFFTILISYVALAHSCSKFLQNLQMNKQWLIGEVSPHFVICIADSVPKRRCTREAATKLLLKITENRQAISDVLCQNTYRKLRKDFWIRNLFWLPPSQTETFVGLMYIRRDLIFFLQRYLIKISDYNLWSLLKGDTNTASD